jgi:hypothetical protein
MMLNEQREIKSNEVQLLKQEKQQWGRQMAQGHFSVLDHQL